MDRNEAVQKLAKVARISVAYAEDLYDSFVPKPVIPYYIADYIEEVKSKGDYTVVGGVNEAPDGRVGDWLFLERVNVFAQAWVNGYIVEREPRYIVRIKGASEINRYLNKERDEEFLFADSGESEAYQTKFTRKELEDADFGWVFDCPGMEVKEVDDGND